MRSGVTLASTTKPTVLLTNDDGPDSPFFKAWVPFVRDTLGWKCFVCLPAKPESFVSKSVAKGPLAVDTVRERVWHVHGPPASAANIALHHLAPDCDFVVSGPNVGHNAGRASLLSSGTVGAAMEGVLAGRKAVAISFPFFNGFNNWSEEEVADAVQAAGDVTADLWRNWEAGADMYNVNVPLGHANATLGARRTVLRTGVGSASYSSLYKPSSEDASMYEWGPEGLRVFQIETPEAGSDVAAIKEGHVSVTPLRAGFLSGT
ncbi:hypothetical protein WJX81_006820 [Elliptochloris bilobata]|uniref:Survival protein SurE-like phosphatase/nucleotidase domain-containing protein n=1 Tax=Elliptochloris bilobata TaxID=381761 RepID=A0AAW1QZS5_9CHLO